MICLRGRRFLLLPFSQVGNDVLDYDDGSVDQHADRDRKATQTHQVRRHSELPHKDKRSERGKRKHDGDGERGAQVAQEQHQQDHDENRRLDERSRDRANGALYEVAPIIENIDRKPVWQRAGDLIEFLPDTGDDITCVRAAQTEDKTLNSFRVAVLGHGTIAGYRPHPDAGNVGHADRDTAIVRDHDLPQVL